MSSEPTTTRVPALAQALVPIASAAAASAVFLYVAGGMVLWIRFSQADVPAARAVSLLPQGRLIETSLSGLVIPLLAALLITVILRWALIGLERTRKRDRRSQLSPRTAVLGSVVAIVVVGVLVIPLDVPNMSGYALLSMWALYFLWLLFSLDQQGADRDALSRMPWTRIVGLLLVAFTLALLIAQTERPVALEPARVQLTDGREIRGVFITQTGEAVYIGAPDVIIGIPNSRIRLVRIGPPPAEPDKSTLGEGVVRDLLGIHD